MIFTLVKNQGVTAPLGFRAAGISAGIKNDSSEDLALVFNEGPRYCVAGVFTTNQLAAAPVLWTRQALTTGQLRAVILNSGGANSCTGPEGFLDTHRTAEAVAEALSAWGTETGPIEVGVCSTGIIGKRLPMERILDGVKEIVHEMGGGLGGGTDAAYAIMTTDSHPKQIALHHQDGWNIGAMAKGAGMLAPSLATMLVVLTTDADVTSADCDRALRRACTLTFDRLDVDGATSTNDTVLLMANGASERRPSAQEFDEAVLAVCDDLATQLLADAEGATKHVVITVTGASSVDDALVAARAIARDNLVKTALFGSDPNWGRILSAVGATDVTLDPGGIALWLNDIRVASNTRATPLEEAADITGTDISIRVDLGVGTHSARIKTTDLSHGYVHENSAYSS